MNVQFLEREHQMEKMHADHKTKAFLKTLVPMAISTVKEGRFIDVNGEFLNLIGLERKDVIGNTSTGVGFITQEQRSIILNELNEKGKVRNLDFQMNTRGGEVRYGLLNSTKITLDGEDHLLSLAMDITDRRQAEEALRSSEAKYRQLYESMMDAFVSIDMNGMITEYNKAFRNMLGYEPEEIEALTYTDLTPKKWHSMEVEIIESQVLKRGYSDIFEKEYQRKDGTVFPIELRAKLIIDNEGKPSGMWAIVRDITERKLAENELKGHRDRLEELVKERTDELSNANEMLKRENEVRKKTEAALRSRERELEAINTALETLLRKREEDKKNIEMNILSNIKISIMPYLEKLESSCSEDNQTALAIVKSNLEDIASPFIRKVSSGYLCFTPSEIQIASLIKAGKRSKEIAEMLNVSINTIIKHRHNLRKKARLKNKKVNLRSYLQTLE